MPITLAEQIAEIGREIGLRMNVYPRLVAGGKLKGDDAECSLERMRAAHATLKWLAKNERRIKALFSKEMSA